MTSMSQALDLYDMAGRIDCLRFQLRALSSASVIASIAEVSARVHTLAGMTITVSDQVNCRFPGACPPQT
ncbi:hypothetical protein [Streptomyces jumonjinensis]|uniref:hypothetical protein n=1 Tax=Streptomyces jumonjinensis TaxID=1945 RepID=UPI0037B763A4